MSGISPFRAPWTSALLVLLVIWSVRLLVMPESRTESVVSSGDDVISKVPAARPGSGYHEPQLQKSDLPQPTKVVMTISEPHSSDEAKTRSMLKQSFTTASKENASAVHERPLAAATPSSSKSDRPLVLYAYKESPAARANFDFFIENGLHGAADFIFIFNGDTDVDKLIPPNQKNIRVIRRENTCFDLGAYAEVLTTRDLYKLYKRFILLNASIRGPFMPYWTDSCWSDMYLDKLNDEVKLVGMTGNCSPSFHVQSMIWALDSIGIELLLFPPKDPSKPDSEQAVGINKCFAGWSPAVDAEIHATPVIIDAGYKVDVMMSLYHKSGNYIEACDEDGFGDVLWNGRYGGTNVHPYDTIFIKTNRDIDPAMIESLTEWHTGRNYSSWDHCR